MGKGGSDVAREAADIVLMDDEFPSIVNAIEEGRVIYDNLKKTIAYTLTHALPEVWPIFLNLVLSFPLGLSGLLILSIDLVTEQGPAISLAYEPAEDNIMRRPPRSLETERLIAGPLLCYSYLIAGVVEAGICTVAFFSIFWWYGVAVSDLLWSQDSHRWFVASSDGALPYPTQRTCGPDTEPGGQDGCLDGRIVYGPNRQWAIYCEAQAAYYVTLVMCQFWHIWMCKTRQVSIFHHNIFRNSTTLYGVVVSLTVVLLIMYIPALHPVFLTYNLGGIGWLPHLLFLILMLAYTELVKLSARRRPQGWAARHLAW